MPPVIEAITAEFETAAKDFDLNATRKRLRKERGADYDKAIEGAIDSLFPEANTPVYKSKEKVGRG